ncbi:MAG: hypothetical protein JRJ84_12440 [Deltaproteobacteria bacterium]|nr:hypothetical protein [Deltaproteobacteria bacterium]
MVRLFVLAVSAVLLLVACAVRVPPSGRTAPQQPSREAPQARPGEPATGRASGPTMADHLSDHFAQVSEAREALIGGDLARARDLAGTLQSLDPITGLPPSWRPGFADTRSAAMRVRDATTLEAAAVGIAEAAIACAECHEEKGFDLRAPPRGTSPGVPDAMWRVRRAEEALWFGLTAPDDARWREGAVALAGDPLLSDTTRWAALRPAEEQMRDMASMAVSVRDLEERGRVYGRLLAACATCHAEERPQ